MPNITVFDTTKHHINIEFFVTNAHGKRITFNGILDTGAPRTEFSDIFLTYTGLIKDPLQNITIKPGLETQRYGKIVLSEIEICGHQISNFGVFVSCFDKAWGIAALIGLDFFRRFRITVDYQKGHLMTEPYR